jgi:hypothetical protein
MGYFFARAACGERSRTFLLSCSAFVAHSIIIESNFFLTVASNLPEEHLRAAESQF